MIVPLSLQGTEPGRALVSFVGGDEEARDQLRLIVGEPPDAAIGLDQPDGEEIVELGMEDIGKEA